MDNQEILIKLNPPEVLMTFNEEKQEKGLNDNANRETNY